MVFPVRVLTKICILERRVRCCTFGMCPNVRGSGMEQAEVLRNARRSYIRERGLKRNTALGNSGT